MSPRDRLIKTASNLLYQKGLSNVGINEIIKEANVAKMTLYQHFDGKEDLILAILQSHSESRRNAIEDAFQKEKSLIEKLERLFAIAQSAEAADCFRGCIFVNSASQISDPNSEIHKAARVHKEWIKDQIKSKLLSDLPADIAEMRAQQILLIWDGAISQAYIQQSSEVINYGLESAKQILSAKNLH